jgi:SAM-dependent methyltransferase/uncharacterized protein YbaR (Trm112 family)
MEELACPSCHMRLEQSRTEWSCSACALTFRACAGIPLLLKDSDASLAGAQTFVRQGLAKLRRMKQSVARASWSPGRDRLRERILAGIDTNGHLLHHLARSLPSELLFEPDAAGGAEALYQTTEVVLRYAVRDWSGQPWDEEQIRTIESSLIGVMPSGLVRANAVLLGAGTCRLARDLTGMFDQVLACDISLPMLLLYVAVSVAELKWAEINFLNTEESSGQVQETMLSSKASKGPLTARPERLTVAVADGTHLPLADQSRQAVLSIYFTDVVRIGALLQEAHRVLAKDGVFIHFGTLGYHHGHISEMLSVEDARKAIEGAGFVIEQERWVSTRDIGTRPDRLVTVLLRNWLVVARKRTQ